ncbi:MAG: phosphatidate cytidylyltransferase [Bacteroidales bacterium]|nr:phosphatidate cytidylyltransferase [Bacteroidales bacterium]
MKELLIRAASGLIYVLALAGTALWNPIVFTVVMLILFTIANLELLKLSGPKMINKVVFIAFFSSVFISIELFLLMNGYNYYLLFEYGSILHVLLITFPILSIGWLFTIIILALSKEVNLTNQINSFSLHIVYLLVPFSFLLILQATETYEFKYPYIIFLFAIIWINDTFAYLGGKLFGKTPLAPKISPKKTIEGLISGILFAVGSLLVYNYFYPFAQQLNIILFVVLMCLTATLGDLIQSKLKREAGVKDSGNLIPGHGGILDRMDSILLTAPFTLLYVLILFH